MYQHILLPTDGSELSGKAISSGIRLAKTLGAKVTGLYVIVEPRVAAGIGRSMREAGEGVKMAEESLAMISNLAKQEGVPCECYHVIGESAHEQIVRTAETKGCDLILMASHGRSGIAAALLGSQTARVLAESTIPVTVYR